MNAVWCVRVQCRLLGRCLLSRTQLPLRALSVPGRQIVPLRKPLKISADVWVVARIRDQDRVVDVPAELAPRPEHGLLIRVVRMQCGDDPFDRIVEQNRANTNRAREFEEMAGCEEGLELLDWLAFVVKNGP